MTRSEAATLARAARLAKQPPLHTRFWSKVLIKGENDCWPWIAAVRNPSEGYGAFWLNGRHQPSNRVAWILTFEEIPEGMKVCHKCDNPGCCNPAHLFLGSSVENNDDKVRKMRHVHGEKVWTAILTEAQVLEIKSLKPATRAKAGERAKIARQYGVSPLTISDIWSRSWKHLDGNTSSIRRTRP